MTATSIKISDMPQFEVEPPEDEPIYLGTAIANVIKWFSPRFSAWMKDKNCGCSKRQELLDDWHFQFKHWWNDHKVLNTKDLKAVEKHTKNKLAGKVGYIPHVPDDNELKDK